MATYTFPSMIIAARTPSRESRNSVIGPPIAPSAPLSTFIVVNLPVPVSRTTRTTVDPFTTAQTLAPSTPHDGRVTDCASSAVATLPSYVPTTRAVCGSGAGRRVSATAATRAPSREIATERRLSDAPKYPGTCVTAPSSTATSPPPRSACNPTEALAVASGFNEATSAVVQPSAYRESSGWPSARST